MFAAYVAYTDHEIGRVIRRSRTWASSTAALMSPSIRQRHEHLRNHFDRHASEIAQFNGVGAPDEPRPAQVLRRLGLDPVPPHMAVGGAGPSTPFKWTKQISVQPARMRPSPAISWPGHVTDQTGIAASSARRLDIVPTILEYRHPVLEHGRRDRAKPIEGEPGLHLRQGRARPIGATQCSR
ncbi:MAG: hypothetical protein U1E17_06310 [Geminicoccaceae bacterium]